MLLYETQKSSAEREATEFFESDYCEKKPFQVENMSLEYNKEKIERCSRAFEREKKSTYGIENQ